MRTKWPRAERGATPRRAARIHLGWHATFLGATATASRLISSHEIDLTRMHLRGAWLCHALPIRQANAYHSGELRIKALLGCMLALLPNRATQRTQRKPVKRNETVRLFCCRALDCELATVLVRILNTGLKASCVGCDVRLDFLQSDETTNRSVRRPSSTTGAFSCAPAAARGMLGPGGDATTEPDLAG